MVSNAQKLAKAKYRGEKRDQIVAEVPKGKRDEYKAKAAALGMSLSQLIQRSVEEYGGEDFSPVENPAPIVTPETRLTAEQQRLVENFVQLPKRTQKHFAGLIEDFATLATKGGD